MSVALIAGAMKSKRHHIKHGHLQLSVLHLPLIIKGCTNAHFADEMLLRLRVPPLRTLDYRTGN